MASSTVRPLSTSTIESVQHLLDNTKGKNAPISRAAKDLLTWIADEGKDHEETLAEDIAEAFFGVYDKDFRWIDVLRTLEKTGIGRFLVGRHGHKTRFVWQGGSSLEVASLVLKRQSDRQPNRSPAKPTVLERHPTAQPAADTLKVGRIEVFLPPDVTPDELSRLIDWLEAKRKGR